MIVVDAELRSRLKLLLKSKHLRAVQREDFSFASLGTLARIRDGIFPKSEHLRKQFNLLPILLAPACPRCGGVHTRKCREKKPPRKLEASRNLAKMIWWVRYLKEHSPIIGGEFKIIRRNKNAGTHKRNSSANQ